MTNNLSISICLLATIIEPTYLEPSVIGKKEMDRKPCNKTEHRPEVVIKQTFTKTKKFFQSRFRNLKSFLQGSYRNTPSPLAKTIFSNSIKINYKAQDLDCLYKSFSNRWVHESNEVSKRTEEIFLVPKEERKGDDQSVADYKLEDLKEEKKVSYKSIRKQEKEASFIAANALAHKMKQLEMIDINDVDNVMDVEEVLHYYSRLTSPVYQEMVDKFFMDMHLEYNVPKPLKSRNNSMRKVGSGSVYGSTRSLGPIKI